MDKLIEILTEQDKDKIKSAVIDIIIKQAKNDLKNWDEYILFPPDVQKLVEKSLKDAQQQFEKFVSDYYLQKMKEDFVKMKKEL